MLRAVYIGLRQKVSADGLVGRDKTPTRLFQTPGYMTGLYKHSDSYCKYHLVPFSLQAALAKLHRTPLTSYTTEYFGKHIIRVIFFSEVYRRYHDPYM